MATRREFLGAAAGLGIGLPALAANDRIQIALIGAGGMGQGDVRSSVASGSKLVAAADVYQGRLTHCQEVWGKDIFVTRDYREVLARPDVDAVIVATPDHWHQQISIDAMNAGKDVYCEKPMTQRLEDGLTMVEAQRKTQRILQVGSQRVSSILYQKARDLYRSGAIGQLNLVEAWWDRNSAIGAWQYSIPPDATEASIDWDRFLGRAPKRPFDAMRLFRWRNYRDYGTGVAGDLFVHLLSGMHFVTGVTGPTRVYATGGLRFWKDGRDVPDVMLAFYDYPGFNLALRVNFVNGGSENEAFRFIGTEGTMTISNGVTVSKVPRDVEPGYTLETFAQATQDEFLRRYLTEYPKQSPNADALRPQDDQHFSAPAGYNDHRDHHRNFLNSVRTRKPVVEDAQFGFRASGPALLANLSYFERRVCEWDPEAMKLK